VGGAVNERLSGQLKDRLLERPNEVELSQHRGEQLRVGVIPIFLGRNHFNPRGERVQFIVLGHGVPFSAREYHVRCCLEEFIADWIQCHVKS
jgi:hypothetical protein